MEGQAGAERAYAHVMVLVTDVNDEPPAFSRPLYETQITEEDDRHLPKPILQVRLLLEAPSQAAFGPSSANAGVLECLASAWQVRGKSGCDAH